MCSTEPAAGPAVGTGIDWSFQDGTVTRVVAALADGEHVLLQSATGTGKTVMIRDVIRRYLEQGGRDVVVVAHRREIIMQTSAKLDAVGIAHGVIQAGMEHLLRPYAKVQVVAIATLFVRAIRGRAMSPPPCGLLIIDEAHHAVAEMYRKVIATYPNAMVMGATATPCRGDGRGLGGIFTKMICTGSTKAMIERGVLVKPIVYAPDNMEDVLRGVGLVAGEYNEGQLAERMDKAKLVGDICTQYHKHGQKRKAILFATSVAHSIHCCQELQKSGVRAEHIDGTTPKDIRDKVIGHLRAGEIDVLCNNLVFTEGFDLPDVSCIILARPTKRLGLFLQMVGRGLRASPNKTDCIVLDHSGATYEVAQPDDDIDWTLDPGTKAVSKAQVARKKAKDKERDGGILECQAPSKDFPGEICGAMRIGGQACPVCGHLPKRPAQYVPVIDGDLVKVGTTAKQAHKADVVSWLAQLLWIIDDRNKQRAEKGMPPQKPASAYFMVGEKFKIAPPWDMKPEPMFPLPEVWSWERARRIAYAKSKQRSA
jgi:DNA repair protein RadD